MSFHHGGTFWQSQIGLLQSQGEKKILFIPIFKFFTSCHFSNFFSFIIFQSQYWKKIPAWNTKNPSPLHPTGPLQPTSPRYRQDELFYQVKHSDLLQTWKLGPEINELTHNKHIACSAIPPLLQVKKPRINWLVEFKWIFFMAISSSCVQSQILLHGH